MIREKEHSIQRMQHGLVATQCDPLTSHAPLYERTEQVAHATHATEKYDMSQMPTSAKDPSACFENMLAEIRADKPLFNPFSFNAEAVGILNVASSDTRVCSGNISQAQEKPEDTPTSVKHPDPSSKMIRESQNRPSLLYEPTAEIRDGFQRLKDSGLTPSKCSDIVIKSPEETTNVFPGSPYEDPLACGSLPIPIDDQYPCFQASPDGDGVQEDLVVFSSVMS